VTRFGVLVGVVALLGLGAGGVLPGWEQRMPMPEARSEVATTVLGGRIVVVGGYRGDGTTSPRVDAYVPARDVWERLPDLPVAVNHAMAASDGKRLYVVGGYSEGRRRLATAFVFDGKLWRRLPAMPEPRAAAGAAVVGNRLYVVGGVAETSLAKRMLVLDLATRRWSRLPSPTPREHLAVVAAAGSVYALGGRTAGYDTNVGTFEMYDVRARRWRALPPVPVPRGGTGAATLGGRIFSVGGEAPDGTIPSVFAYRIATGTWERHADLPTPRHGLGVAAIGVELYAIAGGEEPGLFVSDANEALALG
jgi:non-specific serine/threonine protein kinase